MNLTHDRLLEVLSYDQDTGIFTWTAAALSRNRMRPAGNQEPNGYFKIGIDRHNYRAHQLAWLYVHGIWPISPIDHINRIRNDNRIVNLRLVTVSQQNLNSAVRSISGYRGVYFRPRYSRINPWQAFIATNRKSRYLGSFPTAEEAHKVFAAEYKAIHGEFAGALTRQDIDDDYASAKSRRHC